MSNTRLASNLGTGCAHLLATGESLEISVRYIFSIKLHVCWVVFKWLVDINSIYEGLHSWNVLLILLLEEMTIFGYFLVIWLARSPLKMQQEIAAAINFDPIIFITALEGDLEIMILLNMHTMNSVKFWKHRYIYTGILNMVQ